MFTIPISQYQLENLYETEFVETTPQTPPGHRNAVMTAPDGVILLVNYDGSQATFNVAQNPNTISEVAIKAQLEQDLTTMPTEDAKRVEADTHKATVVPAKRTFFGR